MKTEIKFEDKIYSCQIKVADKETMDLEILEKDTLSFKGKIKLENLYEQIPALDGYSIEEMLSNFSQLNPEKFNIIKDKESFNLDIAIPILKKEKHFVTAIEKIEKIEKIEIKESEEDIIKKLKKKLEENDNRIKSLEKGMKKLKKICEKEKREKEEIEEQKKIDIDISKYTFEKQVDCTNFKDNSLLILKNGRISIGSGLQNYHLNGMYPHTRGTEIFIHEPNSFKLCYIIKDYGPYQIQLEDENLLVANEEEYAIIKLKKSSFYKIHSGKFFKEKIINVANIIGGFAIILENKINFYIKNEESKKYNKYELIDSLDTKNQNVKNIVQLKNNLIALYKNEDKNLLFYDYIKKEKKLIGYNLVISDMKKISNNLLALINLGNIILVNIDSMYIANSIDITKDKNSSHTIKCIYPLNDNLLVYHYDRDNQMHIIAKYKIKENNLIFDSENSNFKMESSIKDIGRTKKGNLVALAYDGLITLYSQEQIKDNEKDDEIFDEEEEDDENNPEFIVTSLIYEKNIERKTYHSNYATIEILKDGRISLGTKLELFIYEANNFQLSFSIPNYGPIQKVLKNGYLLANTKQGDFNSFFSILEIKGKTFNVLQTFETINADVDNPRKTPWIFEEFPNGTFAVLCKDEDKYNYDRFIHFYEKKSEKYSEIDNYKVLKCVFLDCLNEEEILFNVYNHTFVIYNLNTKKERDINMKELFLNIDLGENFDERVIKKISKDYIGFVLPEKYRHDNVVSSVNIFSIEKEQIVEKIEVNYEIKNFFALDEKNIMIGYYTESIEFYLAQYLLKEEKAEFIIDKKIQYIYDMKYLNQGLLCIAGNYDFIIWSINELE